MPPAASRPRLASVSDAEALPGDFGRDAHVVQFYDQDRFLVEAVGEFVRAGIRAAEPTLVVATPERRASFAGYLTQHGHDVEQLIARGLLVVFDATSTLARFMVDGRPDTPRFRDTVGAVLAEAAARSPTGRLRAYGEMVNLLWDAANPEAALRLEELWNQLTQEHSLALMCGYAMSTFGREHDAHRFAEVCRTHSRVIPTERYQSLADTDSRAREVSLLQQRAQALEGEIERRRQVEDDLREALRVRDDFLCVAGHELRTPLTVLRLQLASLLAHSHPGQEPRAERRLAGLATQTERLARLAERLLDVSQLGDLPALQVRELNLTELVRDSVAGCADVALASRCEVEVLAEPSVVGRWDPDRLAQVVQDLLANAFKFGGGGDVQVQVRGLPERAEIIVRDDGIGIPVADQRRIFERFERHVPSESFGGLGLGLWIARRVVEAHGGEIRVESAPGKGATFTVSLPYDAPTPRRRARA
jgi:signal transduction histidine kinase